MIGVESPQRVPIWQSASVESPLWSTKLFVPPECTHRSSIAEMRDDDALAALSTPSSGAHSDVFVEMAVKTIATNARVIEFPRLSR